MNDPIKEATLKYAVKLNPPVGAFVFDNRDFFLRGELRTIVWDIALKLWDKISYLNPDVLVTRGMGGIPLTMAMATFSHATVLIVRDARKTKGLMKLVEGPSPDSIKPGARAVFVDDLMNEGNTFVKTQHATEIEGYDLKYVGAAVFIDFWHGSRRLRVTGTPVETIFRRHELGITRKDAEPSLNLSVAWHYPLLNKDSGLPTKSWPRVRNGLIYVGDDAGHFHCFSVAYGNRVWSQNSESPQWKGNVCVPAFHGGNVIISSYDGTVRALGLASGHPEWTTKVDKNLHSSPCVQGNRIFIGTEYDKHGGMNPREWAGRGDIVALDATNGNQLWRTPTNGMLPGSPIFYAPGDAVFCGCNDFHVYSLDAVTGDILLKMPTMGEVKGKPAFIGTRVYVVTSRGWVHCFDTYGGKEIWRHNIGGSEHPWPLVIDDRLYVTNHRGMGICFDKDGNVKWMVRLRATVGWGFSRIGDRLAVLTTAGQLITIDPITGQRLTSDWITKFYGMKGVKSYQPVWNVNGRLIIATNNRGLLALDYDLPT